MDLPLLVSPDKLRRLHDELSATAATLGQIAEQAEQVGLDGGWQGGAQRSFSASTLSAAGRCRELSRRLASDAARVGRLEEQLAAELAVLHRLEHEVLGALHRLAVRALDDVTGEARSLYDRVCPRLPAHGSPGWRDVASSLLRGGWL
ncbi:MAG: hypothetical protein QOF82_28 [Frankiales bacterium]|jgi:hypothetical protein|nr:hypothetical protein [Frankiales bacterium]